ncbi:MAG: hypothetical protein CMJ18_22955 [Phycisphaeraceae bacterium]|nr:hypothetical protein [Phycisphaeraceae bacterium]
MTVAGCAPYVNIPPQAGDLANHNPNNRNVLNVESKAVRAVAEDFGLAEPFAVEPLADTTAHNHLTLMPRIGELATAENVEGLATISVRKVYIRGAKANVSMVYTPARAEEGRRFVTVDLRREAFRGWTANLVKAWRFEVERALIDPETNSAVVVNP